MSHDAIVVYIITKLELGGAQKICLSLFKGISEQSQIPTHLISGAEGPLAQEVRNNPHATLLESFEREIGYGIVLKDIKTFFTFIKLLRSFKQQYPHVIVHTHSTKAGIMGRWAAFFAGIKQRVHTIHGFALHKHQSWFAWLAVYLCELFTSFITTRFICVSQADRATGIRLFPFFEKRCSLIRAAVPHDQFYLPASKTTWHDPEQPFTYGTVACFKPAKNLFDLLKAFEKVHKHNPHTRLEIIGDGTQRAEIETWLAEHNLSDAVVLHGWQKDVRAIMMFWHAFVLSSLWEGLPCAIVEARLLKLPVLSYNTGGISEVIHDGVNGLLFPQKAWMQLAEGMLWISENQTLYQNLKHGRDMLHDFDVNVMIRQHEQLYKSLRL